MRRFLVSALVLGVVGAVSSGARRAEAFGGWMTQGSFFIPVEQRVAVAVTPQRTTLWTSLRFESNGTSVGLVVPVGPGAVVDLSSDAWFEALEVATAPRVFPPVGQSAYCAGQFPGPGAPFETAGHVAHTQSGALAESAILPDAAAVTAWAGARGLTMSPGLGVGLGSLAGVRFLALRFETPPGAGLTPTVRVATPGATPSLPLSLTDAHGGDLLVTAWLLGSGEGRFDGGVPAHIPDAVLSWDPQGQTSNYTDLRMTVLSGGAATLVEAVGHDGFAADVPVEGGAATVDAVVGTFFQRSAAYDGIVIDPAACTPPADAAFSSAELVAPSCPRAELLAAPAPCVEAPPSGTLDPGVLRCGPFADDLAVALEGAAPVGAWITRQSLVIPDGDHGFDWHVLFGDPTPLLPVRTASFIEPSTCPGPMGGQGGSASVDPGSSGHPGSSGQAAGEVADVDVSDLGDLLDDSSGGCSGADSGGACGGDSGGSCGGDSGGSCGGDSGGGCSGGGDIGSLDFNCSVVRRRMPKTSALLMAALALLAPLRRRGTAARRKARGEA